MSVSVSVGERVGESEYVSVSARVTMGEEDGG